MKMHKLLFITLLFVFAMSSFPVIAAPAASDPVSASFGIVDIQQLITQYDKKKKADTEIKAKAKGYQETLELRNTNKLLAESEMTELQGLKAKTAPTEKDKARITELQDLDKKRDDELHDLQSNQNPTEANRSRLRELLTMKKQSEDTLTRLSKEYAGTIQKESLSIGETLKVDIVEAIKKVATQKNMSMVVDRQAVLFGGTDITASVLDVLNKKK